MTPGTGLYKWVRHSKLSNVPKHIKLMTEVMLWREP